MHFRSSLAALAGTVLFATAAVAQDAPPPPIFQVTTLELAPATMTKWLGGLRAQAAAAKTVGLPPAEFGWWTYTEGNRVIIVIPRERDAVIAGRPTMARIREANAKLADEIAAAFEGATVRLVSQELTVHAPNLSYTPATQYEPGAAEILDAWIAPGQGQAFNEAIREFNEVRTKMGYPYSVELYRVRLGETRTRLVTFIDSRENFYGKNSVGRLMAGKADVQAAWQAAIAKVLPTVTRWESTSVDYTADLSYPPMP